MSMTLLTNLKRIDVFHNEPKTVVAPNKRWHSAFVAIYCSRALISHCTPNNTNKTKANDLPKPTRTPSFTVADLNPHHSFGVDQTTLTDIVKEKDLESLENFGGVEGIATALETHVENGIKGGGDDDSAEDIKRRKQMFGSNTYAKPPFFHFVMEAFKNVTILILLAFAALSLGFGIKQHGPKEGWYDGGSIFLAVFIVISLSSISNFRQNRQFDKLSRVSKDIQIDVVRSGRRQHVSIFDIVVGDVICLKIGDQVPADGLFIEGHSLKVDESNLTLNNVVEIDRPQNPFLFSGAKVVDGYAKMLVTSVGMNTTWGQMMSSISSDIDEETPLQERLKRLTSSIKMVGLAVDFLVLIALLVRYFTGNTKDENGVRDFNGSKTMFDNIINSVVEIVADGLTSFVATIPEGLKLAATLTLADSMKKMIADRATVRKLSAFETMGFVTTICTDKTAIPTLNEMKVTKFWLGIEPVEESAYSRVAPLLVLQLIREGVALNTAGSVHKSGSDEVQFSDSPIEKAILSWPVLDMSTEMEHVKRSCSIINAETFNSEKKISGVLLRRKSDNTVNAHWKGAAEMILKMSSRYYDASGIVTGLDNDSKLKFEHIIQGIAASSNRCIAFAHVEVAEEEVGDEQGNTMVKVKDNGLTLLGLVEIKNPCRPEVKEAVEACQHAGVNVKMITSDNVSTAKVIAAECDILRPNQDIVGAVIEGEQFRKYTPEEMLENVDKICVMVRSSPWDKLLMVWCLKLKGHVVAVTGDGTCDAPALKLADIGFAMGIQGTEVAKESSDIVILDDNFASVVTALRWGRCVYKNIQKFIQFHLTGHVAALVINFVTAVSAGEVPHTTVQLLWVNLIMGALGALALATERPAMELMDKPSVGSTNPLITNVMWRNLLAQALYQMALFLTLQFRGESIFGVTSGVNDTMTFNTFILCQVFNVFNAREMEKKNVFKGILRSKLFLSIITITLMLQVAIVEFLKKFADTNGLNGVQWAICIGLATVSWPIGWVVKLIPVPDKTVE